MMWRDDYFFCVFESNAPFPPSWRSRAKCRIVPGGVTFDGDVFLTRWVFVVCLRFVFLLRLSRRPILIANSFFWLLPLLEICEPPLLLLWREDRLAVNGFESGVEADLAEMQGPPGKSNLTAF